MTKPNQMMVNVYDATMSTNSTGKCQTLNKNQNIILSMHYIILFHANLSKISILKWFAPE